MKINPNLPIDINRQQYISDQIKTESFQSTIQNAIKSKDDKKLLEVCQQFESIFLNLILKNMRSTIKEDGFVPKSFDRKIFEGMLDEKTAENIAQGRGIGLAQQIYQQLSQNMKIKPLSEEESLPK